MSGTVLENEIFLLREHIVSIGAFILKPPDRYIASPATLLRLSAVVTPPGECYVGNSSMIFEWEAFGQVQRYSALNTTGTPAVGELTNTPARLGWEYVVPRERLTTGNHTVTVKVWMRERDMILGQAQSYVLIDPSPLVAVIREAEESITVNSHTTLSSYGNNSYDPDVLSGSRNSGSRNSGLSYEWLCRQSAKNNFTPEESSTCDDVLVPDSFTSSFTIPIYVVEALGDVNFIQYKLIVRKGMDRVSSAQSLTVIVQNGGSQPHLDDYSLQLTNVDDSVLDWNHVPHYEQTIINVGAGSNITWTYELLEPSVPDFFSSSVINNPLFYSEESNIFSVSGNTKPLGIEAGKMKPSTTYRFKIVFSASTREVEATSLVLSVRTADAPTVGFPEPSVTNGTTDTVFTATAGIPSTKSTFSYYFIMTDENGNKFCLGVCTGYNVVYFQVGRAGSYELSVLLFDMQGKALLNEATLSKNVTVHESSTARDYQSYLNVLFNYGDDHTWTQLVHDLALKLLDSEFLAGNLSSTRNLIERQTISTEELLAARMEYSFDLSSGSCKIYCSSFPNSYHDRDCLAFALDLARQSTLDEMTVYNIIQTVDCFIKNTPLRTINLMGIEFASFLAELNRLALNLFQRGNSRRRLLSTVGEPANMIADVNNITGVHYAEAASSGKLDGFVSQIDIGSGGEFAQVSIVVASNAAHLPAQVLNGQQRKIVMGPSGNEMFYATEECLRNVFSVQGSERFVFLFHTTDNFVLLGFQDPPTRSNLADKLYWTQVYRRNEAGAFVPSTIPDQDFCFCWRLPVLRKVQHLANSTDDMPGLYAISKLKAFNESVFENGSESFSYVYENSKTVDYNLTEGWVEACSTEVGLVSTTVVARTEKNILVNVNTGRILGFQASIIVGLALGGLLLLVVALAESWMIAVRAMSDGLVPLASTVPNELFLERDVHGRGTILDANAMTARAESVAQSIAYTFHRKCSLLRRKVRNCFRESRYVSNPTHMQYLSQDIVQNILEVLNIVTGSTILCPLYIGPRVCKPDSDRAQNTSPRTLPPTLIQDNKRHRVRISDDRFPWRQTATTAIPVCSSPTS
ncbi:PKD/REJ-like protein [Gracilaria domingensis]|nr:PKD/REJ-like protein [Gracilaria domingensis]